MVKSEEDANSVGINNSKPIELPTQEETKVTEGNTKKNADDNTGVDKNDANKGGAEGEDKKQITGRRARSRQQPIIAHS